MIVRWAQEKLDIPGAIYDKEMQRNLIMNFLEEHSRIGINAIVLSFVQNSEIVDDKVKIPQQNNYRED